MQHLSTAVRCLSLALLLLVATSVSAQSLARPLSSALNPDGTINAGMTGSFDPKGFRMTSGPNGEPRFVSQQSVGGCTPDSWDTTFTPNGAEGNVRAVASDGAGNFYIGGEFTSVNGVPASRIAKWNGTSWSALGSGVVGPRVHAIAVSGSDVYAGGFINSAGGTPVLNIAKWDGTSWSALGAGIGNTTNDSVDAIAVSGSNVYVGGNFRVSRGSFTDFIAKWDGGAWSTVGTGVNGNVSALAVSGGNLFVGGNFSTAGGASAFGVAKWDGSAWSSLGTLSGTSINTIAPSATGDIYVGGTIVLSGQPNSIVAAWNGTNWTRLAGASGIIWTIAVVGSDVYAGGSLSGFNNIAKWNGSAWTALGAGLTEGTSSSEVLRGMAGSGNTLVVGGNFRRAGSLGAKNIAAYTNGTWIPFSGTGLDSAASAIAVSGTDVYVGGSFLSAGPVTANKIAKWNGVTNTWSSLGGGTDGTSINAIAVAGSKVYAGGSFSQIGGVNAANIAVWNGTVWAPLGTGITGGNGRVSAIIAQGDDILVGGDFTTAGGVAANRIAKWNGSSWSGFPGNTIPNAVTGMAVDGNNIYVTAQTTTADNPNYLSKYDGTSWTGLAPGMGGHGLNSVVVVGGLVYVSGGFTAIGGISANRVAKWNGSAWSALGGGLPQAQGQPGIVRLAASGPNVIAVGDFSVAAGGPADGVARWNGSAWSALGNGVKGGTATQAFSEGGDIFIGGSFTTAGCNASPYFARWRENVWTGASSTDWHTSANWGGGSVPPANSGITISANNATISSADVTVNSLIVTGGRTVAIAAGRTLTVTGRLELSNGFVTGPGVLNVNDLSLNGGDVTGAQSVSIQGSIYLNGGKIVNPNGPVFLNSCSAGAISGGSGTSFIEAPFRRCVTPSATFRFPVGTGSTYAPVELSNVLGVSTSNFLVEPKSGAYSNPATGLPSNRLLRWWKTSGGPIQGDLTFSYTDADVVGVESRYRVYRIEGGAATQLPSSINLAGNRITTTAQTGFSGLPAFTLAEGTPAPLTLSGRVTTASGRGGWGVIVALTDDQNVTRYTMTNPFGYYRFPNVLTFKTYTLQVMHKKFTFTTPSRMVEFDEFTPGQNFQSTDH